MKDDVKLKLEYFGNLANEVRALGVKAQEDEKKLTSEFNAEQNALKSKYEKLIDEAVKPARSKAEQYKKEFKEWFGVTEGEPASLLELVTGISKLL